MEAIENFESISIASVVSVFGALFAAYLMYKKNAQDTGVRVAEIWWVSSRVMHVSYNVCIMRM
jgi:hypothetical protein